MKRKKRSKKKGLAGVYSLIKKLNADPKSEEFREPVDYVKLNLYDYPLIIKKPMDLSTVKNKIKRKKYHNEEEAMEEINLIWKNCKKYNLPNSWIYKMAEYMESQTSKLAAKLQIGNSDDEEEKEEEKKEFSPDEVPFDKRVSFTEKIKKLSIDKLRDFVKYTIEVCPKAVSDFDSSRIKVLVEKIPPSEFEKIDLFLQREIRD